MGRWGGEPPGCVDARERGGEVGNGLAEWGQDGARVARLRGAAEATMYTPGSQAGRPISVLGSLAAPPARARGRRGGGQSETQAATACWGCSGSTPIR